MRRKRQRERKEGRKEGRKKEKGRGKGGKTSTKTPSENWGRTGAGLGSLWGIPRVTDLLDELGWEIWERLRHCSLGWCHSPALGSAVTAPHLPWAPVLSSPSQRLCLAHTPPHPTAASVRYVILPHPVPAAPREISRVPPTYRKESKALRGDVICPKQNTCSRCSWDTDAALWMLWDPFPTLILNGWAVATPLLRTTLANPTWQLGLKLWEPLGRGGGCRSARSQKHKAFPGSSLLRAKITQGGSGWRLAAHDRDWIKEKGQCTSVLGWTVH